MQSIYEHIMAEIENRIKNGEFKTGQKLPSIREIAIQYACSKSTVVKAYEMLRNKHVIYSVPQSGYYILEYSSRAEQTDRDIIDFSTGNTIIGDIYMPDLKHCLDRAVDLSKTYSVHRHRHGTDSLRALLPKYLSDFQIFAGIENIFVNLGVLQALSILTQMPFPNHKEIVLIEQPTYRFFSDFLKSSQTNFIGIKRDEYGIDLNMLEHIFKTQNIKFFYTIPRAHNPLGTAYSKAQRKSIAALAEKYDVYIVEDDYFSDIVVDEDYYDPIYAYGNHYHHIYLKSFSKIIPWFRIGITVIPLNLLDIFQQYTMLSYYSSYFSASLVSQATLDIYIRSNLLKKHVTSIRKELSSRQRYLQLQIQKLPSDVNYIGGESGFYSYLKLPCYVDESYFVDRLKKRRVLTAPSSLFYAGSAFYEKGLRISVSRVTSADICRGFEIICEELECHRKKR